MKRLLITGATGFIGSACLRRLRASSFTEIYATSRVTRRSDGDIQWYKIDLLDHGQITALLEQVKPTHILHAAWEVTPRVYSAAPVNAEWLKAGIHMAQVFGALGGQHFLGIGTSAEYKPGDEPCREDITPTGPSTIYGDSKAAFHKALEEEAARRAFTAAWIRVFVPYGPGDPAQRLVPHLMAKFSAGEIVETTHGRQIRDFIFVDDIAEICSRIIERELSGAYNAGSGRATTIRAVIEHIAHYFQRPDLVHFDAIPLASSESKLLVADMTKTAAALDYMPGTNLFETLDALTSSYLREHSVAARGAS